MKPWVPGTDLPASECLSDKDVATLTLLILQEHDVFSPEDQLDFARQFVDSAQGLEGPQRLTVLRVLHVLMVMCSEIIAMSLAQLGVEVSDPREFLRAEPRVIRKEDVS